MNGSFLLLIPAITGSMKYGPNLLRQSQVMQVHYM